jgi:hypothetical protein
MAPVEDAVFAVSIYVSQWSAFQDAGNECSQEHSRDQ